MNPEPSNLFIEPEPYYQVRIIHADLSQTTLHRYGRASWKRLSAICHARYFARKNPDCAIHVELVK